MPKLLFQGHASLRIITNGGHVVYIDPYKGDGYDMPADIILVTHWHRDHNQIDRCARKPDCRVITNEEALAGEKHNSFDVGGVMIHATEASNIRHDPRQCVGYIITIDMIKLYIAGDTSQTKQMERFADLEIDYAFFPGDGVFNMDLKEAAVCAQMIKAKHNIIYHLQPGDLVRERAEEWTAPNKLILEPGQEIEL